MTAAAVELVNGPLTEHPRRVGKPLRAPMDGRWAARRGQYRVIYRIDDAAATVTVLQVSHRRDAYS